MANDGVNFNIVRGGSYKTKTFPRFSSSSRTFIHPLIQFDNCGFRCVSDINVK